MKTEILTIADSLSNGGLERVVYNIATSLDPEKFKMHVYVLDDTDMYYKEALEAAGVTVVEEYAGLKARSRENKRVLLYKRLRNYIDRHPGIRAVHVHCANQGPEALLAAKRSGVPVRCMHAHNAYSDYWNPSLFPWKVRLSGRFFRWSYHWFATHKLGCSKAACRTMYGQGEDHIVVFNGVDRDKFNPDAYADKETLQQKYGFSGNEYNFLFVGRFSAQKNLFFMLRTFKKLCLLRGDCRLTIVGHGEQEQEVHSCVRHLQLEDKIRFLPPDSNVPELLKASDFFISPSICEGLGIVFVEAQLMGIPAFASDQVPVEADLGMCEFVPLSLGEDAYAQYISRYMDSHESSPRALDQARAGLYDMRGVAALYEQIYTGQ